MSKTLKISLFFLIIQTILIVHADLDLSSTTVWETNATTVAGSSLSRLSYSEGIDVDENDTLYIADAANHRIVIITINASNISMVLGTGYGSGLTEFYYPRDVFVTKTAIYVLDSYNYRVQKYAKNGSFLLTVAGMTRSAGTANTMDKFGNAFSLLVDNKNYLYVSDSDNHRILRFPPNSTNGTNGTVIAGTGTGGYGSDQLNYPRGISIDHEQNLYIADTNNHRIQKYTYGACYGITVAGVGVSGNSLDRLYYPTAVVVDSNDYLYIVDQSNNRIVRWPPNQCMGECIAGNLLTYSGQTADRLYQPSDLSFGSDGSLYICDYANNRVQKFQRIRSTQVTEQSTINISITTTIPIRTVSNISLDLPLSAEWIVNATTIADYDNVGLSSCYGMAIDDDDTVYIADTNNHRILLRRSNSTNVSTILGNGQGSGMNQFNWPTDVFVTATALYVLDAYNYRVQKFSKNGTFLITVAGITGLGGNQNILNRFGVSYGLFVDNEDYLYVSDSDYHRVLRFPPNSTNGTNGIVLAGTGTGGYGPYQLNAPRRIYVDRERNLYVADMNNHRIQKYTYGACYGITVAGVGVSGNSLDRLYYPTAVVVDSNDYLYIVDQSNNRIVRWPPNQCMGECIAGCSSLNSGSSANRFDTARDIAFDSNGSLYVVDGGNRRIQKFSLTNFSRTITPSPSTIRSQIPLNCLRKANIDNHGSLAYGFSDYSNRSCDECMCSMIRMNTSTTVICREDIPSCRMIYSHPSLLMPYVKIDLKSRVCYRSLN